MNRGPEPTRAGRDHGGATRARATSADPSTEPLSATIAQKDCSGKPRQQPRQSVWLRSEHGNITSITHLTLGRSHQQKSLSESYEPLPNTNATVLARRPAPSMELADACTPSSAPPGFIGLHVRLSTRHRRSRHRGGRTACCPRLTVTAPSRPTDIVIADVRDHDADAKAGPPGSGRRGASGRRW